jgi:hypothetical protein
MVSRRTYLRHGATPDSRRPTEKKVMEKRARKGRIMLDELPDADQL